MLTADLVRARWTRDGLQLRWADPDDPEVMTLAQELIAIFEAHDQRPRWALDDAVADHIGDATDFMLRRGLVKLLTDRSTFEAQAAVEPAEVRRAVFAAATARWPVGEAADEHLTDRAEVLAEVAEALGVTAAEVDAALYADLKREELLVAFEAQAPRQLIERYNLALAQAVLLRAREVVVELHDPAPKRARQLFRIVKFHRLMHRAERIETGWRLTLDGPLSLFRQTQRYGLQLALFLPALCHCKAWSLRAEVAWGPQRKLVPFALDHEAGLVTHTREKATWESEEERHFKKGWAKLDTPWKLRRATEIIDLDGRGVLVPAYVLRHADGRRVLLEIVWFWQRRSFQARLELLREAGPERLIIALAMRMNTGEEDLPDVGAAALYPFKGVISPKRVAALAASLIP